MRRSPEQDRDLAESLDRFTNGLTRRQCFLTSNYLSSRLETLKLHLGNLMFSASLPRSLLISRSRCEASNRRKRQDRLASVLARLNIASIFTSTPSQNLLPSGAALLLFQIGKHVKPRTCLPKPTCSLHTDYPNKKNVALH
jgi:hypothetical protein